MQFTPRKPRSVTTLDLDSSFTRHLLRTVMDTARAKPNETGAEYNERYSAAAAALAAFGPRDPLEQMLAAQLVAANYAALDCLDRAMAERDPVRQSQMYRAHSQLTNTINTTTRALARAQKRGADALVPQPGNQVPAQPVTGGALQPRQQPRHREKPPAVPTLVYNAAMDPSKMDEAALKATIKALEARIGDDPTAM